MLDLIDQARQRNRGAQQGNTNRTNVDNVNIRSDEQRPDGNSTEAALRRLRKDRPDLHQRVIMGPVFLFLWKSPFPEVIFHSSTAINPQQYSQSA